MTLQPPQHPQQAEQPQQQGQPTQGQQKPGRSLAVRRKMTPSANRAKQIQAINGPKPTPMPTPTPSSSPAPAPAPVPDPPHTPAHKGLFQVANPLSKPGIGRGPASLPGLPPAHGSGHGNGHGNANGAPRASLLGRASSQKKGQQGQVPAVPVQHPNIQNQGLMSRIPVSPLPPSRAAAVQTPPVPAPVRENNPPGVRGPQPLEVQGNNVILHRGPNFFVRTTYRPEQKANPLRRPSGRAGLPLSVDPAQEERMAARETKELPTVTPINPVKVKSLPVPIWAEAIVVIVGLLVACVAHAINMFNFPRYELDEGTYMANAWAILHGMISPYAYGYGHPPLAWIQIAAWIGATGTFTFGNALNSGRVLMLLYACGCSLLVYLIVRRLGSSRSAGLLALVVFSLSPLSLTYQRQVLLDNVGTFWLLLSLYFLVVGNSRLLYISLAAVSFGIAFLSKEIFVLFLPTMIYATWLHTTKFQRKFALVAFTYIAIAICSMFVLMAVLKGELFPPGWLPGDTHTHLSLIGTYLGQLGRGQIQSGSIQGSMTTWTQADMVYIVLSIATTIFNLVAGWWNRKLMLLSLMAISFWALLLRGGVVFPFYIIPLIPLVALNIAMTANTIMGWIGSLTRLDLVRILLIFAAIAAIVPYDAMNTGIIFNQHPTSAQTQALAWIHENVPHNDVIVINSYLYTDLHEQGGAGVGDGEIYPHADVYQNVATDPTIYQDVLQNNWDRIDYIVADSEMLADIKDNGPQMQILTQALNHSILRTEFRADDHSQQIVIQVFQVQHKITPPIVQTAPGTGSGNALAVNSDINVGPRFIEASADLSAWPR